MIWTRIGMRSVFPRSAPPLLVVLSGVREGKHLGVIDSAAGEIDDGEMDDRKQGTVRPLKRSRTNPSVCPLGDGRVKSWLFAF